MEMSEPFLKHGKQYCQNNATFKHNSYGNQANLAGIKKEVGFEQRLTGQSIQSFYLFLLQSLQYGEYRDHVMFFHILFLSWPVLTWGVMGPINKKQQISEVFY